MAAEVKRVRLSIPVTDEVAAAWLENQANMSVSMRLVIKDWVRRHGLGDAMASYIPEGFEGVYAPPIEVNSRTRANIRQTRPRPLPEAKSQIAEAAPVEVAPIVEDIPAPAPAKAPARRKAKPKADAVADGPGILLGGDALSDFGIDLGFGANDGDATEGDGDGFANDMISMMAD